MENDPTHDVVRPDEYQEVGDEIYCWMPGSYDRECNGSCVAFDQIFEGDQRRSPCSLINIFKSTAMSHAKVANIEQAKARAAVTPNQIPPEVR